jgi:hypothetical protein
MNVQNQFILIRVLVISKFYELAKPMKTIVPAAIHPYHFIGTLDAKRRNLVRQSFTFVIRYQVNR